MVGVQAKFKAMVESSVGHIDNLPPKVKARVEYLKELQIQHDGVEEEYQKELEALNLKYQRLYGEWCLRLRKSGLNMCVFSGFEISWV